MKKQEFTRRTKMLKTRGTIHHGNQLTGSAADKFPVILDSGRTDIFISDRSKEAEIRAICALRHTQ